MAADILNFLTNLAGSIWAMLIDSAFLLCLGLVLAGAIHLFLNRERLDKMLRGGRRMAVFKAALFGVPLPLCSCSVLPVADQLRKSGVGPGPTTAFLISTPETGVDSILLTYAMMDPLMTVARPVTAFATALTAGLLVSGEQSSIPVTASSGKTSCECGSCDCANEIKVQKPGVGRRIKELLNYAVFDLLDDLAPYLFIGYLLAGLVAVVLGGQLGSVPEYLKVGWLGYVGAIIVGLPLYVCATSSTPLAAVLWGAGFSPGAVLVFLMVGPATNVASLTVVTKILKRRAVAVYLGTIVAVAVIFGIIVDSLYRMFDLPVQFHSSGGAESSGLFSVLFAVVLLIGIVYFTLRKAIRRIVSR